MIGNGKSDNGAQSVRIKTGLLGGAFNPPHAGHLSLARAAVRSLSLDRMVFIPSASPPHKMIEGGLSFEERMLLTEMAVCSIHPEEVRRAMEFFRIKADPGLIDGVISSYGEIYRSEHDERFSVSDVERGMTAPTYTFDVVSEIGMMNPSWDMYLIMGMDQAVVFDTWYRYGELSSIAHICAAARPGYSDDNLMSRFPFMTVFPFDEIDVSSSDIRQHLSDRGGGIESVPSHIRDLCRLMYLSVKS